MIAPNIVAGGDEELIGMKVDVFGTVVVDEVVDFDGLNRIVREFSFLHTGTSSSVVITIQMRVDDAGLFPVSIGFAVDKHANLVLLP